MDIYLVFYFFHHLFIPSTEYNILKGSFNYIAY